VTGRLERRERVINVLARDIRPAALPARDPLPLEDPDAARVRQVVPAAQDFARGRR